MSSTDFNIDQSDLEKLNDKDKAELRQFFSNEEHRARIQARICWKKCISASSTAAPTGSSLFRGGGSGSGKLDGTEQTCLANCVDRFMDANLATMKHLANMRQQ
ncbi:hypothetical protein NEMBOFW57_000506 [Staphylotrichum longicolle]|uniref:Mitochondrial import inner membrane translocase subunit n=1 Tax=Staphylotrichum longicolle TaxID=669026 RepID=A0AAD4EZR7_9PEZI|nr:hypothetical protein NEMBOFW57_000506 [Staphylotrichum longicolle]